MKVQKTQNVYSFDVVLINHILSLFLCSFLLPKIVHRVMNVCVRKLTKMRHRALPSKIVKTASPINSKSTFPFSCLAWVCTPRKFGETVLDKRCIVLAVGWLDYPSPIIGSMSKGWQEYLKFERTNGPVLFDCRCVSIANASLLWRRAWSVLSRFTFSEWFFY